MTNDELDAIRKRDAEMEYWQVTGGSAVCTDRRVLLGYVDALAAENAALRHAIKMELEMYGADQPELTVDLPTAKGG